MRRNLCLSLILILAVFLGSQLFVGAATTQWPAVRLQDGVGNSLTSATAAPAGTERGLIVRPIPSTAAQPVSGTVTANQGTSPWVTSGTSTVSGTVTANQGTNPWIVSGAMTGTVTANQGTSPWVISGTTTANQGTSPWVISGAVTGTVTANAGSGVFNVIPSAPAAASYLPVRLSNSTGFDPTLSATVVPSCTKTVVNAKGTAGAYVVVDGTAGGVTVKDADATGCDGYIKNVGNNDMNCGPSTMTVSATAGVLVEPGLAHPFGPEGREAWKCTPVSGTTLAVVVEAKP